MVSSLTLAYIHLRLEELFGTDNDILFVGDILQLPPVNGNPVFENINRKALLGCATSVNIWRECITYDELTINERQKKDRQFTCILDAVWRGLITEETTAVLERCIIADEEIEKKFNELMHSGKNPVCNKKGLQGI